MRRDTFRARQRLTRMSASEPATVGHFAETHAQHVIDTCMDVYQVCRQTAAYCANQQGAYAAPHRTQVLHDCAEIHLLTGDFLARASPYHRQAAGLACEIAQACADAFREIEHDDPQLRKLYAVCAQATEQLGAFLGQVEMPPKSDARDEALKGSFPASDPPPAPSNA